MSIPSSQVAARLEWACLLTWLDSITEMASTKTIFSASSDTYLPPQSDINASFLVTRRTLYIALSYIG